MALKHTPQELSCWVQGHQKTHAEPAFAGALPSWGQEQLGQAVVAAMMGAARAGLCFFYNIQKVHAGPEKSAWRGCRFVFVHLVGLQSVLCMGG